MDSWEKAYLKIFNEEAKPIGLAMDDTCNYEEAKMTTAEDNLSDQLKICEESKKQVNT